jgi:LPS export ABC transporter protein LptC
MHATRYITTLFAIILFAASAAWVLLTNAPKIKLQLPADATAHRFTALDVQQFDPTGQRIYHLTAPDTYHLANEDTHHLNHPMIFVTKANRPTWTIQSEEAVVTPKAEEIKFLRQVEAHHAAYQKHAAGVFKTEAVSYFPQKKWVHTPLFVSWDQADNHVEAIGMQANLTTQKIELLEKIEGTYQLNKNTSHLEASRVTTKMNKKNRLSRASAFGNSDKKAHFWTSDQTDTPPLHAYADTIYYHPITHQLELIGHANLMRGKNTLTAPHIRYDTQAEQLITTAENNKRTLILIDPTDHLEKHL